MFNLITHLVKYNTFQVFKQYQVEQYVYQNYEIFTVYYKYEFHLIFLENIVNTPVEFAQCAMISHKQKLDLARTMQ